MTDAAKGPRTNRTSLAGLVGGREPNRAKTAGEPHERPSRLARPPLPPVDEPLSSGGGLVGVIPDAAPGEPTARAESTSGEARARDLGVAKEVFHHAVAITKAALRKIPAETSLATASLEVALGELLEGLQTSEALLLPFFSPGGGSASPAQRAVRVCILSLRIGLQLNYSPDRLRRLGLAALLSGAAVDPDERDDAQGVLDRETHEHIVGLASLFEDLVRSQPVRSGFWPYDAIKEVLRRERGTFPDEILKALIRIVVAIPAGCLVRLNTGEICRVVAKNDRFLLRPQVAVLVSRGKRLPEPRPIDLSEHPFLHIDGFATEEMLDRELGEVGP